MKERIIYLEYLKALAIFFVIIYHSKAYDDVFLPPILSMCVTIFFAANGYLMLVKRRPCLLLFVFTANFINVFSWKFNPLAHWYHYEAIFYYVTGFFAVMYAARINGHGGSVLWYLQVSS